MKPGRLALAFLLLVGPIVRGDGDGPADPKALPPAFSKGIEALVTPRIAGEYLVGVSIGVIDGDREGAFGFGHLAYGDPRVPDADTVYEIGSVSKTFTGILLAHAVEDGLAKLDDPVQNYLPDGVTMPSKGDRPVTLKDLSTHRSGLPRMPANFAPADSNNPYADYDASRLFEFLNGFSLGREPGEAHEYSNLAVGLLGCLLGAKGVGYEKLLEEKITAPLGMTSTSITLSEEQKERFAAAHLGDTTPAQAWSFKAFAGAGAIRSTVRDMLRFARANLDPDDTPLGRAIRVATSVQQRNESDGSGMGLGWIIAPSGVRWHNGQTGGYHSFIAVDQVKRRAVVVLSNTGTALVDQIGDEVMRLLAGMKVDPPVIEPLPVVAPSILERYVGVYALSPAFKLTVTREGGRLFVQATAQPRFRVFPESDTEFAYRVVEARLVFEVEAAGPAKSVVLHQGGMEMRGARE